MILLKINLVWVCAHKCGSIKDSRVPTKVTHFLY